MSRDSQTTNNQTTRNQTIYTQSTSTAILVMAAGKSSRFGADKRQALIDGKTMLQTTLDNASPWKESIRVVLTPKDKDLQSTLAAQHIKTYVAPNAQHGMGHSLADAIQQLAKNEPNISHCLVLLADMPFLKTGTLQTLLDALETNDLIVPVHQVI